MEEERNKEHLKDMEKTSHMGWLADFFKGSAEPPLLYKGKFVFFFNAI